MKRSKYDEPTEDDWADYMAQEEKIAKYEASLEMPSEGA
jgi:hypothetical protein